MNVSTSSSDCVVDYGATGTWLRVPLGKLGTERSVPLDADTVAALDAWPPSAASSVPILIPALARPPTSSSPSTVAGSRPGGSERGFGTPSLQPGSPVLGARRCE